jgi:ubiquinone/menaquinone biosynthesis C-methylase UbiE
VTVDVPKGQARCPSGFIGKLVGHIMNWYNRQDNDWTISLLDLQPADHVSEIGFGPGQAIKCAAQHVTHGFIAGVDLSPTMVEQAKRRNASYVRTGRVELRQGDVAALPYENASFDKIFAVNCIYFWPEPMRALREMHRVLKPQGLLAITVRVKQHAPYSLYTGDKLTAMLSEAGFRQARFQNGPDPGHPIGCVLGTK